MSNKGNYRQDAIMKLLIQEKTVAVEELAKLFSVTPTTIRRDLLELEANHQIIRSRGYAFLNEDYNTDDNRYRINMFHSEKQRIAKRAMQMVSSNSSLLLDSGTTILELAKELNVHNEFRNICIITNGLDVALSLSGFSTVSMPPGVVDHYSKTIYGVKTTEFFSGIHADIAFIGSCGILHTNGPTISTPFLLDIKQKMIQVSNKVILLIDSSKFLSSGFYPFCDFNQIDAIITVETGENKESIENLRNDGIEVILA